MFLVHEDVLTKLGVSQPVTFALYASIGLAYLACSWRAILDGWTSLFVTACAGLAGSMGFDALAHREEEWILLEDGLQFLGIAFWAGFHISAALAAGAELVAGRAGVAEKAPSRTIRIPSARMPLRYGKDTIVRGN